MRSQHNDRIRWAQIGLVLSLVLSAPLWGALAALGWHAAQHALAGSGLAQAVLLAMGLLSLLLFPLTGWYIDTNQRRQESDDAWRRKHAEKGRQLKALASGRPPLLRYSIRGHQGEKTQPRLPNPARPAQTGRMKDAWEQTS